MTSKSFVIACVVLSACTHSHEGVSVSVGVEHVASEVHAHHEGHHDESASLTTDLGYAVTLTEARVTVASVGLATCDEHAAVRFFKKHFALVSKAHAHGAGDATSFEHAHVQSLLGEEGVSADIGEFAPPADTYCGVHIALGDATNPVVQYEGSFVAPGESESEPFAWELDGAEHFAIDFVEPLVLDEENPEAAITLRFVYGAWLDGLTLGDDTDVDTKVRDAINASTSVRVER